MRIRKSFVFLLIWVVGFGLGLYLVPSLNYLDLIAISFFNAGVVSIFVFGIAGITHRETGRKVFGVLLIMVLVGFLYQNSAMMTNINSSSISGLYASEANYVALIPAIFQSAISSIQGPTIDSAWVQQFMSEVNSARQAQGLQPMSESSSLDQFAQQRLGLETEGTNWEITHYGYQNMPPGVGEVVYYPDGYTPSGYASNIQSTAQLHWNLMMDSAFSAYGFAVGRGTTLGVYQPCSATELPGPGINITQWFAQHGCKTVQETSTWLVIDMS